MKEVELFSEDQKGFLKQLVSDFHGPTSSGSLLYILESTLDELKSDWRLQDQVVSDHTLQADLEVCMAALAYLRVKDIADGN